MEKRRFFLNPASKSPWESEAPKTNKCGKKKATINDENNNNNNNNFRSPQVTKYVFRPDLQYRNIGFFAHSGHFHSYYQSVKQALFEKDYVRWAMAAQNAPVNPQRVLREVDSLRGPIEVIDITEDEETSSGGKKVPKKSAPKKSVKLKPKTEEGCEPKDTTNRALGVVITKKSTGYVARLL